MAPVGRYKATAEQHYKDTRAARAAEEASDEIAGGPDGGYRFNLELCRRTFDAYDRDGSGFLDITELTELAEVCVYAVKRPPGIALRRLSRAGTHASENCRVIPF